MLRPWTCYRFETFKKSKKDKIMKYLSGELCNGKSNVRLISFQQSLRSSLITSLKKKNAV